MKIYQKTNFDTFEEFQRFVEHSPYLSPEERSMIVSHEKDHYQECLIRGYSATFNFHRTHIQIGRLIIYSIVGASVNINPRQRVSLNDLEAITSAPKNLGWGDKINLYLIKLIKPWFKTI